MELWELTVVLLSAIVPSLIYLIWIRNSEIYNRERWGHVLSVFFFGATISILASVLLESLAIDVLRAPGSIFSEGFWNFAPYDPSLEIVILAVVIAPLVEEWAKGWGVLATRNWILEPEDGLIYGAAAGLGFAAVENIFYNSSSLLSGIDVFVASATLRALTSTLLHATASGVLGFGIARKHLLGARGIKVSWIPFFLAAVLLHAIFNGFAVAEEVFDDVLVPIVGLIAAFVLVIGMFGWLRRSIQVMDREN